MRLRLRVLNAATADRADLLLTADPDTPCSAVVGRLDRLDVLPLWTRGCQLPTDETPIGAVLRDGDVVTTEPGGPAGDAPVWSLMVVGGPLGGHQFPLQPGAVIVGRSPDCDVVLDEISVSRRHACLTTDERGCIVDDLGSRNGTGVNGHRVSRGQRLAPGDVLEMGAVVCQLRQAGPADADVRPDGAGCLEFNRPPRIRPPRRDVQVVFPAPPAEQEDYPFPWAQVVIPIVLAGVGALVFKRPEAMIFALMSPVLAISSAMSHRRRGGRRARRDGTRYAAELAAAQRRVEEAAQAEADDLGAEYADPSVIADRACGPGRRLWERRGTDVDATTLRIGMADREASVVITSRGSEPPPSPPVIPNRPVTVDLAKAGVLGVAGPVDVVRGVARWLVAQLAVLRSPRDLQIVVLTEAGASADWDWVRWLPHARVDDPRSAAALIGIDRTSREERVKEIVKTLDLRVAMAKDDRSVELFFPTIVVVMDGVRALRAVPGLQRVLREGPPVGILSIGLDTDANRLAEEGKAEIVVDAADATTGVLNVEGEFTQRGILLDQVDSLWADDVARGLCPLRDTGANDDTDVIPAAVRFVDVAGIDLENPDDIVARWLIGGRTTQALVGAGLDGPFVLDLKSDGPHALVAGTTGAGKSEFLQTLVTSLAVANRPTAMNFVLIDYKGGSAFEDCARLPHTTGMVTNLDGHLTERALLSLDAELKRRELALHDLRAPHIDAAWEQHPELAAQQGLARLVIVIDEFAELVHELPDFVSGLIRVARVGRSLGVHLILATQRPAGVITGEMRANTALRIAFRVVDRNESMEVLEAPDAAAISPATPGRGYARIGGAPVVQAFQAARVAGRRKGAVEGLPPPHATTVTWERLGYPPQAPPTEERTSSAATDLSALVSLLNSASEQMGLPTPHSPLLPPLPATVVLDLPPAANDGGVHPAVYGLVDLPADQRRGDAQFPLAGGAHLIIAGSARSGRSTALRTLAASVAQANSPSDVHIYGLDYGNGALGPLADLPHTGAVCSRNETERAERLAARLYEEVGRRHELFSRHGFGDIEEQRRSVDLADRLPYLVLLVDRWEGLLGQFGPESLSELPATMLSLVREGPAAGLRMVLAGDRSLLTDRLAAQIEDKILLRLNDREDYRIVNLNPKSVPEGMESGRALRADDSAEIQIGLLTEDPSSQAQGEAVRRIAAKWREQLPAEGWRNKPFEVKRLPSLITLEETAALARADARPPLWTLVGLGGDNLDPIGVDLAEGGGGFVVAGPNRSGRSTALAAMARGLITSGARLIVVCPRSSPPLERLEGHPGVAAVLRGEPRSDALTACLAEVGEDPLAVVVDDAEALVRTDAEDALVAFLRDRPTSALVIGGLCDDLKSPIKGIAVQARQAKTGLLLSPQSTFDGELLNVRLARNQIGRQNPGRGLLVVRGETVVVQVPVSDSRPETLPAGG